MDDGRLAGPRPVHIGAPELLLSSVDRYIECRILARLPANIPQTAMTATELADALGTSIQSAFKNYVPQVDQVASAMRTAVEGAMQTWRLPWKNFG